MRIEPLASDNLPAFISICQTQPERYYFFQLDRKLYPNIIKIQLIVNDSKQICGMIGSYHEWNSIRIVGEKLAIVSILPKIELNQHEIFFPKELKEIFLKRMTSPVAQTDHIRFIYNTSPIQRDENIPPHIQKLTLQDLPAIQSVLSRADPEAWIDYIPNFDNNRFWYGIKNTHKKLISVAGGWNECDTSFLLCVATDPDYQRQGYVSQLFNSLLSYLMVDVKQVMVETLMKKNAARNLYKHLGFIPMYEYIVFHVNNVNTE